MKLEEQKLKEKAVKEEQRKAYHVFSQLRERQRAEVCKMCDITLQISSVSQQ